MEMDGELPTQATVKKLRYHMDLQQATQLYLWSLALVGMARWRYVHEYEFGAKSGDIVYYESYTDKMGILTGNANTPYCIAFVDLSSGPYVIDTRDGGFLGGMYDMWQRVFPFSGPYGARKYIILAPGAKQPEEASDYVPIQSSTMNWFFALRLIQLNETQARAIIKRLKLYPFSKRDNPPESNFITIGGKRWHGEHPNGMPYWKLLHDIIQVEPVHERDRLFMDMLHWLGIEKGKPFAPTAEQQKVLLDGAHLGELMAKANSFAKRFPDVKQWSDRDWVYIWIMENANMSTEYYDEFNKRACFAYEAIIYVDSNMLTAPGPGQVFLGTYTDERGAWLDGAKSYTLHVPPNVPAMTYFSFNIYDSTTRCLIDNQQGKGAFFSLNNLTMNADGSYDFKFGPKAPTSSNENWVQTVPGRHWFVYLRLYYPLQAFFDKSWKLENIKRAKYY